MQVAVLLEVVAITKAKEHSRETAQCELLQKQRRTAIINVKIKRACHKFPTTVN